jgi:DNA-binding transcriptional LysR family regulator
MCSYFRTIEQICAEQGLEIQARFRANEDITALNFVAEGLGVTITSRAQLRSFADRDALFILPHFHASLPLCLGYLESRADEPAVRAMREATQKVWADQTAAIPLPANVQARLDDPAVLGTGPRRTRRSRERRSL